MLERSETSRETYTQVSGNGGAGKLPARYSPLSCESMSSQRREDLNLHIVYLLENVSKTEKRRFYIGSKCECDLLEVRGIPTIVGRVTGKAYYGSSTSKEMQSDLKAGHTFVASILEEVSTREKLREREGEWLQNLDVAGNDEYYNLSNNPIKAERAFKQIANRLGETYVDVAKSRSSLSKMNSTAVSFGFKDVYDFYKFLALSFQSGMNSKEIADVVGCNRHLAARILRHGKLKNILNEDPKDYIVDASERYMENISYDGIAEELGITTATAFKAVSLRDRFELQVSKKLGLTNDELDDYIAREIVRGSDLAIIAKELDIDYRTVLKYFIRFFRRRFKLNEFKRIQRVQHTESKG